MCCSSSSRKTIGKRKAPPHNSWEFPGMGAGNPLDKEMPLYLLFQELSKPFPHLHLHQDSRGKQNMDTAVRGTKKKKKSLGLSVTLFWVDRGGFGGGETQLAAGNGRSLCPVPCAALSLWALIIWRHIGTGSILPLSAQLSTIPVTRGSWGNAQPGSPGSSFPSQLGHLWKTILAKTSQLRRSCSLQLGNCGVEGSLLSMTKRE